MEIIPDLVLRDLCVILWLLCGKKKWTDEQWRSHAYQILMSGIFLSSTNDKLCLLGLNSQPINGMTALMNYED